ncbi:hypothetical protein [Bdellovibrio sp. NC01]|uniref:hypothetical protein n=1 Tax=Bdellovibrio sp. NC01 TaxID=2220073 RepID=UPI00115786E3|nr:hypothetical protein [Bdellovibrio sp. NC01]QDK37096.1 hypothetical protein DOE51_05565 [Bdellovibrio sp. NC01]
MMKLVLAAFALVTLSSCATIKHAICDCAQPAKEGKSSSSTAEHSSKASAASSGGEKTATGKEAGIVVDNSDIETSNRMSKAVDAYVFKNQKDEFTNLCKDERFDCFVNEKRFPKGRKKIKRKVPPFLSGSKMGLQGETRVRVKYDFYP